MDLTDGNGVDQVVEVGGPGTLQKSIGATGFGGHIAMIGSLQRGDVNVYPLLRKSIRLYGIFAGSRDMNTAINVNGMRPVVDQVFDFVDARSAFHALGSNDHFGKIVIRND